MRKHLQRLPRFHEYSLINGDHQFSARKIYILRSSIDLAEKLQNCEKETYKPQHLTCRLSVIVTRQIITSNYYARGPSCCPKIYNHTMYNHRICRISKESTRRQGRTNRFNFPCWMSPGLQARSNVERIDMIGDGLASIRGKNETPVHSVHAAAMQICYK